MDKTELIEIIQQTVETTIKTLVEQGIIVGKSASPKRASASKPAEKSAYQRTEQLLFNYRNFQKIIREKQQEIEDIRTYGVLEQGAAVRQYAGNCGGKPRGIVLDEEKIEEAVKNVERSMETTLQAIALIDKCMATLSSDPYYKVLEMRYFEDRTQEDIAVHFGCTQQNIAYHKSRLVKELSIKLFPDKVAEEILK